jgi:TRAP transporter TAXI family solute receptor
MSFSIGKIALAGGVALGALALAFGTQWSAQAQQKKDLPRTVVWTAYDVGSGGYSSAASIGHVMAQKEGITMRVIPGGNDIARQSPLAARRAHFGALGIASFLSQEGVMEFGAPEWGPQPMRILNMAWADFNTGVASCAADSDVKMVSDMKGKRIAWVVGAPALNLNMTGWLAGGGLTWDDVQKIEFPSWGASTRAVREGQADCWIASTNSGGVYELANSPRGYQPAHMPKPQEDPEAWKRLRRVTPYYEYNEATIGAKPVSKETPHVGATYGYPIVSAYADQDEELVYQQTRMIVELNKDYKDAFPGNEGYAMERQRLQWVIPYHPGAVRYYKERGVWKEEEDKHNARLIERQKVLAEAWEKALAERDEKKVPVKDFATLWMKHRAEALKKGNFEPYWVAKFW